MQLAEISQVFTNHQFTRKNIALKSNPYISSHFGSAIMEFLAGINGIVNSYTVYLS